MVDDPNENTGRFSVPEPPVGMGSGFLSDYWQSRDPLPRIRGPQVVTYYLQQGVRTILALPTSSAITVMTIAVSLFLLAGFLLILQNVNLILANVGSSQQYTAYLKEGIEATRLQEFVTSLESDASVRSVTYLSKDEALELFRKDLGPRSGLLKGIEENNPLPASIDVVLRGSDLDFSEGDKILQALRQNPLVSEVVYGSEWVEKMRSVVQLFRMFGLLSLLVALAIITFLISNTIKLVIYARRNEISIMQLVGASDTFIRVPFMIGGLLQGFVGSVLGLVFLRAAFALVVAQLDQTVMLGLSLPSLSFLGVWATLAIVLVGLIVGAVGSSLALGKFMNV